MSFNFHYTSITRKQHWGGEHEGHLSPFPVIMFAHQLPPILTWGEMTNTYTFNVYSLFIFIIYVDLPVLGSPWDHRYDKTSKLLGALPLDPFGTLRQATRPHSLSSLSALYFALRRWFFWLLHWDFICQNPGAPLQLITEPKITNSSIVFFSLLYFWFSWADLRVNIEQLFWVGMKILIKHIPYLVYMLNIQKWSPLVQYIQLSQLPYGY